MAWKLWFISVCHPVYAFVLTDLLVNIHCNESGLRSLASATLSILDPHWDSLGYPVVVLGHSDPAALSLQDWPSHVLITTTDVA